jgi:hypothetical protein
VLCRACARGVVLNTGRTFGAACTKTSVLNIAQNHDSQALEVCDSCCCVLGRRWWSVVGVEGDDGEVEIGKSTQLRHDDQASAVAGLVRTGA